MWEIIVIIESLVHIRLKILSVGFVAKGVHIDTIVAIVTGQVENTVARWILNVY